MLKVPVISLHGKHSSSSVRFSYEALNTFSITLLRHRDSTLILPPVQQLLESFSQKVDISLFASYS